MLKRIRIRIVGNSNTDAVHAGTALPPAVTDSYAIAPLHNLFTISSLYPFHSN